MWSSHTKMAWCWHLYKALVRMYQQSMLLKDICCLRRCKFQLCLRDFTFLLQFIEPENVLN